MKGFPTDDEINALIKALAIEHLARNSSKVPEALADAYLHTVEKMLDKLQKKYPHIDFHSKRAYQAYRESAIEYAEDLLSEKIRN